MCPRLTASRQSLIAMMRVHKLQMSEAIRTVDINLDGSYILTNICIVKKLTDTFCNILSYHVVWQLRSATYDL